MTDSAKRFSADRPLIDAEEDRFGFSDIAKNLASSVISSANKDGMVIAIEGKWGSGKSSLINLMQNQINNAEDFNVSTIALAPWLIGHHSDYVPVFMEALSVKVDEISKEKGAILTATEVKKLAKNLRKYGSSAVGGLASLVELIEVLDSRFAIFSKPMRWMQKQLKPSSQSQTIDDLKANITQQLKKLNHRFVIVLDDLDRLEPKEAIEVMRLVRSVADFPNVIYLLCYDKEILAHAVKEGLRVEDGEKYLQKIVQVSFHIPEPEAFDLRHWLNDEVQKVFNIENGQNMSGSMASNIYSAIDYFGGMETPRDVVEILNSIKFHYAPVKDEVFFPDLVWLHMIKIMKPDFYKWCEKYLNEWSVIASGDARLSEGDVLKTKLMKLLQELSMEGRAFLYQLRYYIPGLQPLAENDVELFQLAGFDIAALERDKRLGSPHHSRYYFAFSNPKTGMTSSEIEMISELADDNPEQLRARLIDLANDKRQLNGSWLEYYFDRLLRMNYENWSAVRLGNMAFIIADLMDEIVNSPILKQHMGRLPVTYQAVDLMNNLLNDLRKKDENHLAETLKRIFMQASSIVWLLDNYVYKELLRHGKIRDRDYFNRTITLDEKEVEDARQIILKRLNTKQDRERLYKSYDIISPLFRWRDFDNQSCHKPSEWFKEFTDTDEKFLHVLNGMRGWSESSDTGVYHPLSRYHIEPFASWNDCVTRLHSIAQDEGKPQELRNKAQELIDVLDDSKRI